MSWLCIFCPIDQADLGLAPNLFQKILLKVVSFKIENGTDPLFNELNRGKIDVIPHKYYYNDEEEFQNIRWPQPIIFSPRVLLIGPKALIPSHEPLTLLLAPFTSTVWLLALLYMVAVALVNVLHKKSHNSSRRLFCLRQ